MDTFNRDDRDDPRYKGHRDNISAFATPQNVPPKKVRGVFNQTQEYIDVMYHNTMADYSAFFIAQTKEARRQLRGWTPAYVDYFGSTIEVSMAVEDSKLMWSLVIVSDMRGCYATYIIVRCAEVDNIVQEVRGGVRCAEPGAIANFVARRACEQDTLHFFPNAAKENNAKVRILGYIGSYMQQAIAWKFAEPTPLMLSVMNPSRASGGDYCTGEIATHEVPINEAQKQAVLALRNDVELVQGPPGTGKSTTIYHIINSRIPLDKKVLVTCSRNGAVDSIAGKLKGLQVEDECYLLVEGNADRVGPTAKEYMLDKQVTRHSKVCAVKAKLAVLKKTMAGIKAHLQRFDVENVHKYTKEQWRMTMPSKDAFKEKWEAFSTKWNSHIESLYAERFRLLQHFESKVGQLEFELTSTKVEVKESILEKTRIFLSTIAVSDRLPCDEIHTCIVDEAGCMAEQELGILLGLKPTNLILIGDHKQLSPFTNIRGEIVEATKCNRSFFARAVDAAGETHMHFLDEQYRMPPALCDIVSRLFYEGRLRTADATAASRLDIGVAPVRFISVAGREDKIGNQTSPFNEAEVDRVGQLMPEVIRMLGCIPAPAHDNVETAARIAVMTPYKAQKKHLQEELAVFAPDVEVITIDSAQGLEYDLVVLSMVKTGHSSFLADAKRANVAISRAKYGLVIVGDKKTLSKTKSWKDIIKSAPS